MTHEQENGLERELARRFRQLRREESMSAPPLPPLGSIARQPGTFRVASNGGLMRFGAALAAAVLIALILLQRPQSPDELYRDVMDANVLLTDGLLSVSPLALPERTDAPALYDPQAAMGPQKTTESRRI